MHVMIHYAHSADQARTTMAEAQGHGVQAATVQADLHQIAETQRTVDATIEQFGQLDLLVCNAGIWGATPLDAATPEQWDELYTLNARAPFFLAQRAAPHLRQRGGAIVAITDTGIFQAWKGYTPYLSSKAALAMVVQNLAKDFAPDVRVNGIAPGVVMAPDDWSAEKCAQMTRRIPLQRFGTGADVGAAVCYLASADYVTGVILPVDGGLRL
jgi:pteridine reductase